MPTISDHLGNMHHTKGAPSWMGGKFAPKQSPAQNSTLESAAAHPDEVVLDVHDRQEIDRFARELEESLEMDSPHPFWVSLRYIARSDEVAMEVQSSATIETLRPADSEATWVNSRFIAEEFEERYGAAGFEPVGNTIHLHWEARVPRQSATLANLRDSADELTGRLVNTPLDARVLFDVLVKAAQRAAESKGGVDVLKAKLAGSSR